MWNERQKQLLTEFCELGNCTKSQDQIMQSGTLQCDEVAFTLLPDEQNAFGLRVFAQFGEPPPEQAPQIWRRLLEINLFMPHGRHERLAMEPATGCVIFSYALTHPSAAELLASLRQTATHAHSWRLSYFLDDDPDRISRAVEDRR